MNDLHSNSIMDDRLSLPETRQTSGHAGMCLSVAVLVLVTLELLVLFGSRHLSRGYM